MRRAEDFEKNGKLAEAAEAYEQAFRLNDKLTSAALKLTQLYAGPLQKPDKAMDYARKVRALAPMDAGAAAVLGEARKPYGPGDLERERLDDQLVLRPVMPPSLWVASTKRCKDAGSARCCYYGRD